MRDLLFCRFAMVALGLVPTLLWADPKPKESYLIHPSTQTVERRQAVLAVGQTGGAQAEGKLGEALSDKDPMTRALAAQQLGNLKIATSSPQLSKTLATDSVAEVRQAAAVSLTQIGGPEAMTALRKALQDSSPNVRVAALTGLGRYRDAPSASAVAALCKDKTVEVRRTAVFTLSRLEDRSNVPTLEQLSKSDPDLVVRAEAIQALGELHSSSSKEGLKVLLKDPAPLIQASAARSLMMLGDESGLEMAQALSNQTDVTVSITAIDALGWSKSAAAETELQTLLMQATPTLRPAIEASLMRTKQLRKQ